ncbi:MAG: MBL fold metallo-hydrolase [Alphaproteobacteria bacterium]|nr:MBL fold metallo-hydrolase [Alphaproteobacteria bacterium]
MEIKLILAGSRPWELWAKYWGLSYLIDGRILFDSFANYRALAWKAKRANVDLDGIESIVISHHHWDHVGGLWPVLERKKGIPVYFPPHANEEVKAKARAAGANVLDAPGIKTLSPNVFVTDEIVMTYADQPMAEHSLALKTDKGLVLVVGCSHPGISTMVEKAGHMFKMPVYGIIGGLHLMESSRDDALRCAQELKAKGVGFVAPTHCTGGDALRAFKKVFGDRYVALKDGQSLSV